MPSNLLLWLPICHNTTLQISCLRCFLSELDNTLSILTAIFSKWVTGTRMPQLQFLLELKLMGDGSDNWSYKTCKAPVKLSPTTNQYQVIYKQDAIPVAQPTVSKHWKKTYTFHGLDHQAHLGSSSYLVFDHWRLLVTLGRVANIVIINHHCRASNYNIN